MKNKASLTLMEQLVMVLVFALAAAVCLEIFVRSCQIGEENQRREEGLLLARNAVQCLKAGRDPWEKDTGEMVLHIESLSPEVPGYLQRAKVTVSFEDQVLCTLVTGWQEVGR